MSTGIPVTASNAAETAKIVKEGAVVGSASVRRSPSIAKLAAALCAAQGEIANPIKNKQNPHLKNWYADLTAVLGAVLPTFTKHKLCVSQLPCEMDGQPALMTLLFHESGEWIETVTLIRPGKTDPQSIGSAQSYARRYALQAVAGVAADDDDDGNASSRPVAPRQQQQGAPVTAQARTPTVAHVFKTLAERSPTTPDDLRKACGYAATKLSVAVPGTDRDRRLNDILEAVTDAAKLSSEWQWETLSQQNVTDGYAALIGYVKGEMKPATAGAR